MRFLTFSRPECSASRIARAADTSRRSSVWTFHGISSRFSTYVRAMLYSGDDDAIWLIRDSCFFATWRTSSLILLSSIFLRSSSISALSSCSPSSSWIFRLLSRSALALRFHALAVVARALAFELGADIGLEPEHGRLALERRDHALEPLHRIGLDQKRGEIVALELEVWRRRVDELVRIGERLHLRARQLAAR